MSLNEDDYFVMAARRYCRLVEADEPRSANELVRSLHDALAALLYQSSMLKLPDAGLSGGLPAALPEEDHQLVRESMSRQLGPYDLYWEVHDPCCKRDEDPISATLGDDLADIYWELKRGLAHVDGSDLAMQQAIWHWRFGYESHWGRHLVDAIRVVHSLMFMHDVADDA